MSSHSIVGEVLSGPERRRRWSDEQKRSIVAESLEPGAIALAVARRHGISSGLLYTWRRRYRLTSGSDAVGFVAVSVLGGTAPPINEASRAPTGGAIGIELPGGVRLQVDRHVEAATLRLVLTVLGSVR